MAYVKYRNRKITLFGIQFDSEAEGRRYLYLRERLERGEIQDLILQPSYEIYPAYRRVDGTKIQAIHYYPDFTYTDCATNQFIVEDVKRKQTATDVYKLKKKLFEHRYQLLIHEVDA